MTWWVLNGPESYGVRREKQSACLDLDVWMQSDRQKWAKGRGKWTPSEGEILSVHLTHTHTQHVSVTLYWSWPSPLHNPQPLTPVVTHTHTLTDTAAGQQWGDAEQRQSDGAVDNTGAAIVFTELRPGCVSVCVSGAVTKQLEGTSLEIEVLCVLFSFYMALTMQFTKTCIYYDLILKPKNFGISNAWKPL